MQVFYCKLTGKGFSAKEHQRYTQSGRTFVQVVCKHCDASNRTRNDPAFDRNNPQVHTYELTGKEKE